MFRVHEDPSAEKLEALSEIVTVLGLDASDIKPGVQPSQLQKILRAVRGTDMQTLVNSQMLRSMAKAQYSEVNKGHFGLVLQKYSHFTSPIRRYPDLQIHRIIKEQLRGRLDEDRIAHYRKLLPEVAKHSSETERRADEAERETDKLKKAEYMEERLGEIYDGIVSGITAWGIYVELPNTVEGLVHVSRLSGDYFYYNESKCEMVGEATGRSYKLGMPVKVSVRAADRFNRTVDFDIAE